MTPCLGIFVLNAPLFENVAMGSTVPVFRNYSTFFSITALKGMKYVQPWSLRDLSQTSATCTRVT